MKLLLTALLVLIPVTALKAAPPSVPAPSPTAKTDSAVVDDSDTTIGIDDVLNITVLHVPELTRTWRVGASGNLQLPVIGTVHPAGKTIDAFEADLVQRLNRYLKAPNVTVTISERRSAPVTFTGAVERPGTLQLQNHRKLFEAVVLAGGFKTNASFITLTRRIEAGSIPLPGAKPTDDGMFSVAKITVREVLGSRSAGANVELKPNDVVDVQLQQPRLVYVIGEVAKPGTIELADHSSVPLTKALAAAGGPTRMASTGKILLRKIAEDGVGTADSATVDLKKIYKGKAGDLDLTEGYIIMVPSNETKAFLQTASLAAINSGIFASMQVLIRY